MFSNSMSMWGQPTASAPSFLTQPTPDPFGIAPMASGINAATAKPGFLDGLFGGMTNKKLADGSEIQGWGGTALGLGQGLLGAYMGMKQYGIAKDTLEEGKRQFQLNYDAQKTTTNSALQDRQRARVASNPGAYVSVGEYMNQNGIK